MLDKTGAFDCRIRPGTHWVLKDQLPTQRPGQKAGDTNPPILLSSAPEALRGKAVRSVWIDTEATDVRVAVPPFLLDCPELCRISLPSQISASLRPDMLPSSVRELYFDGDHDRKYWKNKTVVLTGDEPFFGIESLIGTTLAYRTETRFRFQPTLFPNLTAIGFTFDAKRKFGETLRQLPRLTTVSAAAFDTIDQLADFLPAENIVSLTLAWNRKIDNLDGIDAFPNLRYLKITSLTHLRTLGAVASLQQLEHIGLYWSKRIEDAEALLSLPRLKRIRTFGNDNWKPVWQALEGRAIEAGVDVSIGAQ